MRGIIHWYNANRKLIWRIIGISIITIVVLQLVRFLWKQSEESQTGNIIISSNSLETSLNSITLEEEKSVVTGENISEGQTSLLKVLDEFVYFCNDNNINKAYNLLSDDCKSQMYPTVQEFKNNYYNKIFSGKAKNISVENWVGNIYKVKFLDDALSTGIYNTENTIQDYITLTKDNEGNIKININNYIGKQEINVQKNDRNFNVKVIEKQKYMDYEIYTFEITNNLNTVVLLNDLNNLDTMYLEDSNNIKYYAYTHELSEAELKLNSRETKKISIKYYNKYSSSKNINNIVFTRIILDYNAYANYQNVGYYDNYGTMNISL